MQKKNRPSAPPKRFVMYQAPIYNNCAHALTRVTRRDFGKLNYELKVYYLLLLKSSRTGLFLQFAIFGQNFVDPANQLVRRKRFEKIFLCAQVQARANFCFLTFGR